MGMMSIQKPYIKTNGYAFGTLSSQDCHKEGAKIVRYHMLGQKQKITSIIIGRGSSIPPFIVFVAIQVNYRKSGNFRV